MVGLFVSFHFGCYLHKFGLSNFKNMKLYECFGSDQATSNIIKCIFYGFLVLININYDFAIFLCVAMFIDMGFGITASLVLGIKFKKKTFLLGFLVKMLILIIPFTVAVLAMALNFNFILLADFAVRLLLANECLSILANFLSIKNKKRVENVDIISIFINWIRKIALNAINKMLNDKNQTNG